MVLWGGGMGQWGISKQSEALDKLQNPQNYNKQQPPKENYMDKLAKRTARTYPSRGGDGYYTPVPMSQRPRDRRNPQWTAEERRNHLENLGTALDASAIMCTATGVGAPVGAALGAGGTAIGTYLTWTDPEKNTKQKVISTVVDQSVGKVFGVAADAAPTQVKKATIETIGYGINKAVGNEMDREFEKENKK